MTAIDHLYKYPERSSLVAEADGFRLRLAAERQRGSDVQFFQGDLLDPVTSARCLRAVSDLVGTRFYIPPSMLARILREADPVVTVTRDQIRFEGFSGCCSTYIRHDLGEPGYRSVRLNPGTTNVDFHADMRAALAKVRNGASLKLSVRADAVELHDGNESIVEKKVALPVRWIKGFAEVQAHLAGASHKFSLPRVQAQRFLRSLPRAQADHEQWATPTPQGARLSLRESDTAVMIKGTQRLRLFENLAVDAKKLDVYFNERLRSSAWVLDFESQRITLVLNSEPWRGFSGDGQLLPGLSAKNEKVVSAVRAQLNWQASLDTNAVAKATGHDAAAVDRAFGALASQGLLGFDLSTRTYFHRVLPFDLSLVAELNPRLKSAKSLVQKDAVSMATSAGVVRADVSSNGVVHQVKLASYGSTCTCPWFAKHQGNRGPCKHVLATEMTLENQE